MRNTILRWIALAVSPFAVAAGCTRTSAPESEPPIAQPRLAHRAPPGPPEIAVIRVAGYGEIELDLLADVAPDTVANFKKLANAGFYDGTTFHRVVPGFVIQGGDPNSKNADSRDDGVGGPGYRIPAELNDTPHRRGTVSMARGPQPDSAGSQFFIVLGEQPSLDRQYTAFGRVIEGMDVADRVVAAPRDEFGRYGPIDRPFENVVIESVRVRPARPAATAAAAGAGSFAPPMGSTATRANMRTPGRMAATREDLAAGAAAHAPAPPAALGESAAPPSPAIE